MLAAQALARRVADERESEEAEGLSASSVDSAGTLVDDEESGGTDPGSDSDQTPTQSVHYLVEDLERLACVGGSAETGRGSQLVA